MTSLIEAGVWQERRTSVNFDGQAALFLDRDGVINVNHGYVGHPKDVDLIEATAALIAAVNQKNIPVIVVTNQSGVGRGYFNWSGFEATMDRIHAGLQDFGAHIDMVCGCAYHQDAQPPYRKTNHEMRKPNPGMLHLTQKVLGIDLTASVIVGDSISDIAAGAAAGLAAGYYVGTGWCASEVQYRDHMRIKCYDLNGEPNSFLDDCTDFFARNT